MARYVRGQAPDPSSSATFSGGSEAIGAGRRASWCATSCPTSQGLIITAATLDISSVVLNEAVLSLLGLGIQAAGFLLLA